MKIKLRDEFILYLETQPEQGMGYQIVDVVLKNGKILRKKLVFNCSLLNCDEDESIKSDDIVNVIISNK